MGGIFTDNPHNEFYKVGYALISSKSARKGFLVDSCNSNDEALISAK